MINDLKDLQEEIELLKTKPYNYQIDGIKHGFNFFHDRKRPKGSELNVAIFDEMGVGKTKQAIDIASIAYENNLIDYVIVVCPKSVRGTWDNQTFGQIAQHCSSDYYVMRFDQQFKSTEFPPILHGGGMLWVTISYSYLRSSLNRFLTLVKKYNKRALVIFDESSYIKGHNTGQSAASKKLSELATARMLLNGTPIANNRLDLWSQFNILDPVAIDNIGYFHFRARYAIPVRIPDQPEFWVDFNEDKYQEDLKKLAQLEAIPNKTDKQYHFYQNLRLSVETQEKVKASLERLLNKLHPWIIRRKKADVLTELPKKLPFVFLEAQMTGDEYRIYKEMKQEMVAWASKAEYSEAVNGAVKLGRLSQITSGFLGGIQILPVIDETPEGDQFSLHEEEFHYTEGTGPKEVGKAKINTFVDWYGLNLDKKIVIWCRFRSEMFRLRDTLELMGKRVGMIIGGQKDTERDEVIQKARKGELDIIIAHPRAGGWGVDGLQFHFHTAVYMSLSFSLIEFLQSGDRLDRIGQTEPVSTIIILATSPKNAKTVDHLILEALIEKDNIASWTMEKFRNKIKQL